MNEIVHGEHLQMEACVVDWPPEADEDMAIFHLREAIAEARRRVGLDHTRRVIAAEMENVQ